MLEFITSSLVYSVLKDGINFARGRHRSLSPGVVIALRQKWKPLFEAEVHKNFREGLRSDAIIRDMKRIDRYPDAEETKGISPWFRVGLIDTYHRGILVGLGWHSLVSADDGKTWRSPKGGEQGDTKVMLAGRIPYESIESVDWDGDEYYPYPHIYCFFDNKSEPYEHVGYYTKSINPGGYPFHTLVAEHKGVLKANKRFGVSS